MTQDALEQFLAGAVVDDAVFALRPDYRALLLAVDGVVPGPSDDASEALLLAAETAADEAITDCPIEELPHVAAWRDAYRSFGVKPQRTRHSLEAMLRRVEEGLPRVNRLTDIYNSISVRHQIPIGGEDLQQYDGSPRLVRSAGNEPFDTVVGGMKMIEHPDKGEVIWRDDTGVTCRRWNWRQGRRTALSEDTTSALFILDILKPMSDEAAEAAADELLAELGPDVRSARRIIRVEPVQ
ncbi:phenylalanine--tRNA ligase beta subunit-related protein [Dermatophilaceae bacterium Sec6.4]